jgi:hypothetical protein
MSELSDRPSRTSARHAPDVAATAAVVSLAALAVGLGGIAVGVDWAWVAFPVGYGGVLPLAVAWARRRARGADTRREEGSDALSVLRERYASGEIDETAFEDRLERLLESEERDGRGGDR